MDKESFMKLVEEQRESDGINRVEFLNFKYEVKENKIIIIKLSGLSINGCDIYGSTISDYGFKDGPFTIYFDHELEQDDDKYKGATFDKNSLELRVRNNRYSVIDYEDIVYFVRQFANAEPEYTLSEFMKIFIDKQTERIRTISGRPY